MSIKDCKTLADVLEVRDQVKAIVVTNEGGRIDWFTESLVSSFLKKFGEEATEWRAEYALCSTKPIRNFGIVSFIVWPKEVKHAQPSTPAAMAKRFRDATPAEMRG